MRVRHLLAGLFVSAMAVTALGATYTVDPVHSSAVFRIRHNNVSNLYGRFNAPEGTITYDAAKPEESSFNITIKIANVDTANPQRDTHLKSAAFFNVAEMPTMTFKSTGVKKGAGEALEVTGDLTVHGVKKPVTVTLEKTGEASGNGRSLIGFEGTFNIKRSDFGMSEMLNAVGDDVRIMVSFEAGAR